jgi:hypothetical protein
MSYPRRWSYQFPDGEYRVLCNQTYFAANNGEDDDIYFIVEDAEWALLFPHHPRVMVEHVCKLTDFPDTQTYRVEIQVDFTPQFYVREITATSPEAAQRIAENVPLEPHEQDDLVASVEIAGWEVEGMEGEE